MSNSPIKHSLITAEGASERDWTEDFTRENGQYSNRCVACDKHFIGHKRRHVCRACNKQENERWNALSPEQQAIEQARNADEILALLSRRLPAPTNP